MKKNPTVENVYTRYAAKELTRKHFWKLLGMMLVTFSTGEKRLFDTTTLDGPAFAPLADEAVFSHPVLFHDVITWNNGEIDVAPETVYRNSYAYESMAM